MLKKQNAGKKREAKKWNRATFALFTKIVSIKSGVKTSFRPDTI